MAQRPSAEEEESRVGLVYDPHADEWVRPEDLSEREYCPLCGDSVEKGFKCRRVRAAEAQGLLTNRPA